MGEPSQGCCPGGPFSGHRAWCAVLQAEIRPVLEDADRAKAAAEADPVHADCPQGRIVTEWAVQYAPDAPLTDRPPYMFEVTDPWTEETAKAEAASNPQVVVYARERTVYADRLSDWGVKVAAKVCECDYPYIGTQMAGEPIRCEACRGLVDEAAQDRLDVLHDEARARMSDPSYTNPTTMED